jgi:hypothetical protein
MFRAIVPDFAKGAGTLMALGADCTVMSDTSELGPIDPRVTLVDSNGNRIWHSVQNYLDAYDSHRAQLEENPGYVAAQIMWGRLDPGTIKPSAAARERARKLPRIISGTGCSSSEATRQRPRALLDTHRWQSHGQMISWQDAKDAGLGPAVDVLNQCSKKLQGYWQLYCLQPLAINDGRPCLNPTTLHS